MGGKQGCFMRERAEDHGTANYISLQKFFKRMVDLDPEI
jgi:hypothetical protein